MQADADLLIVSHQVYRDSIDVRFSHAQSLLRFIGKCMTRPRSSPFGTRGKTLHAPYKVRRVQDYGLIRRSKILTNPRATKILRIDLAESLDAISQSWQYTTVRIDRQEALLSFEAAAYRRVVTRFTALMGYLDLILLRSNVQTGASSGGEELTPLAHRARKETVEIAAEVHRLHQLNRSVPFHKQWSDLTEILNECIKTIARDFESLSLEHDRQKSLIRLSVHVDPVALSRAIFWLIGTVTNDMASGFQDLTLLSCHSDGEVRFRIKYRGRNPNSEPSHPISGTLLIANQRCHCSPSDHHLQTASLYRDSPALAFSEKIPCSDDHSGLSGASHHRGQTPFPQHPCCSGLQGYWTKRWLGPDAAELELSIPCQSREW